MNYRGAPRYAPAPLKKRKRGLPSAAPRDRGDPRTRIGIREILEIPGISTTPGGTLRVFPPRQRVLAVSAKFHPIARIPWKWTPRHPVGCRGVHDPPRALLRSHTTVLKMLSLISNSSRCELGAKGNHQIWKPTGFHLTLEHPPSNHYEASS